MESCPSCDDEFETERGMKTHHATVHGESIAGVSVECSTCGEPMRRAKCEVDSNNNHFCSWGCRREHRSKHRSGEDSAAYKGAKVTKKCPACGSVNERYEGSIDGGFCNRDCYGEWLSNNVNGKEHPRWKGGFQHGYGPNWDKQRNKRLKIDDHKCVVCHLSNGAHKEKYGAGLSVHHIERKENFRDENGELDYEAANDVENLITLCDKHHKIWEGIPLRPKRAD